MWEEASVEIDGVGIRYRTHGEGSPIVFVHGVYVGSGPSSPRDFNIAEHEQQTTQLSA